MCIRDRIDVLPHPDFVPVIEDGSPRQREQEAHEQLDLAARSEQRREPAADPEVDASLFVLGVDAPHVVAVFVRHHLEGQLVVVAQEGRPLTIGRDFRGLLENVEDRESICLLYTSDAADERSSVDLGGRRIIKQNKETTY